MAIHTADFQPLKEAVTLDYLQHVARRRPLCVPYDTPTIKEAANNSPSLGVHVVWLDVALTTARGLSANGALFSHPTF